MQRNEELQKLILAHPITITAADAAKVLGCDPDNLRKQIARDPLALGFPITKIGHRIHIPFKPFVKYLKGN